MARNRTLRTGSASCKKAQPARMYVERTMVLRRSGGRFADDAQLPLEWSHAASAKPANKEGGSG
jgi:hypothetical protein